MGINSYAQNFEDVMLWRALSHVEHGFYIDVGAQDPVVDSVSLAFYERGWHGIHIEPVPQYADTLRQQRPGDLVLQAAVGNGPSVINFFEIINTGLSTADSAIAAQHEANGFGARKIMVPCIPLAAIFDHAGAREIHWLKIDVEGFEKEVLGSWTPSAARPWIVVIESTLPRTQVESHESWESILLAFGYSIAYFDGLNRYYVSSDHVELKKSLSVPPNTFDDFTLNGTASAPFHRRIESQNALRSQALEAQMNRLREELASQRASAAARQEALTLNLQEAKAEYTTQLASAQEAALREWKEQEIRHLALQSALDQKVTLLQGRISDMEAIAARRETEFSLRLQREMDSARSREQHRLQKFRETEQALGEWRAALQSAHQQHINALENNAQAERQKAAAEHEQVREQLVRAIADGRRMAESLASARNEIAVFEKSWLWRFFFAAARKKRLANVTPGTNLLPESTKPHSVSDEVHSFSNIRTYQMNENLDPSKPAHSVADLLKFNDSDFVQCAYLSLLGRPVDSEGLRTYLTHVRAGADRLDLIRALATSPEGSQLDPDRLSGLREALRNMEGSRPTFISRLITGPVTRALRPLLARVDVCDYRIGKLEQLVLQRLDALERDIQAAGKQRPSGGATAEETEGLARLTERAKGIYFQIRDREQEAKEKAGR
jgi:FkbM family methyltransferase